ncbi:MAG: hypothetical protein PHQ98_00965 [Candidatus ainarchaeum sp.]|jgi:hypothetical protein|nr:hypothetical protein [Candidatus ainarchaeum sp.]
MNKPIRPKGRHSRTLIKELNRERRKRRTDFKRGTAIGTTISAMVYLVQPKLLENLLKNPTIKNAISSLVLLAPPVAGVTTTYLDSTIRKRIKELYTDIFHSLKKEVKSNKNLETFLKKYNYIIITYKGKIAGTNMPRILGIGKRRIKTSELLN